MPWTQLDTATAGPRTLPVRVSRMTSRAFLIGGVLPPQAPCVVRGSCPTRLDCFRGLQFISTGCARSAKQDSRREAPAKKSRSAEAVRRSFAGQMIVFLRRLLGLLAPYRGRFVAGILSGVAFGLANAALVFTVKLVVDAIFPMAGAPTVQEQLQRAPAFVRHLAGQLGQTLPRLESPNAAGGIILFALLIPLVTLIRVLAAYLNFYLLNWVAVRAVMDLRTQLFAHLQNLSLAFFHGTSTGNLISRISNDTYALTKTIASALPVMIRDPLTLLVLAGTLLWQQPRLTLISLVVMPVCLLPIISYGRKVRKSSQAIQTNFAELTHLMEEAFTGSRIVKAYNLEETILERFRQTTRKFISHSMRVVRSMEIPSALVEFMAGLGVAMVFLYLSLIAKTRTTPGDFLQFVGSIFLMYQPIKSLARLHSQLELGRAASQRIFELLDEKPGVADPDRPVPLHAANAVVQFDHVTFAYNEKRVLQDVALHIQPGQLVALVGPSGSGKTTLTNLLLRFYDPQKGAVRIGGTDIRDVATRELRSQLAVVTQDTILFNDTIRYNIALGRPGANNGEIEEAAKHAFAHEFILEKPRGYDTVVGEKGVTLSGGQRQRIAIARAILRNAPILILDEATNALDTESERAVQAALEELMKGRTTICIAHRLSTVQKADLIVVLDQGCIVETGRHPELIKRGGLYQKLYELQFQS